MGPLIFEGPLFVNWNYDLTCNFNCTHCYSRGKKEPAVLSTEDYKKIADVLIKSKVFRVNLGGGEPILRNDCIEIIDYMTRQGLQTYLSTNGWFMDDEMLIRLKQAKVTQLSVSLDHSDPQMHDQFRNKEGSYKKVLSCITKATNKKIEVMLSTVITQINFDVLEKISDIAIQHGAIGVDFKRFRPYGNGQKIKGKYELTPEMEIALLQRMTAIKKQYPKTTFIYHDKPVGEIDSGCPCAKRAIALRPNGDISPCVYDPIIIGNILKDDLLDLWQNSSYLKAMRNTFTCCGRKAAVYA